MEEMSEQDRMATAVKCGMIRQPSMFVNGLAVYFPSHIHACVFISPNHQALTCAFACQPIHPHVTCYVNFWVVWNQICDANFLYHNLNEQHWLLNKCFFLSYRRRCEDKEGRLPLSPPLMNSTWAGNLPATAALWFWHAQVTSKK